MPICWLILAYFGLFFGPTTHVILHYTPVKCFRTFWTHPRLILACGLISSSGEASQVKKLNIAVVKIFWWVPEPKLLLKCKLVLDRYLGHFGPNRRICFFRKWPYVYSLFWPFSPYFWYLCLLLTSHHQKYTYSITLDAKRPTESEKSRPQAYLIFWAPQRPENPFWAKMTPKWLAKVKIGPDTPNGA